MANRSPTVLLMCPACREFSATSNRVNHLIAELINSCAPPQDATDTPFHKKSCTAMRLEGQIRQAYDDTTKSVTSGREETEYVTVTSSQESVLSTGRYTGFFFSFQLLGSIIRLTNIITSHTWLWGPRIILLCLRELGRI